ncbi:MAG: undecaprenyl/decaprenyl-phosphate alpha-N-acetylglucosaminyl 1-phosphate transferase [Thermoleophilaceae bacterium]|nr:undecaprenyl/decaprenyl-phosphate alpha-N-acetylglucosaminyl 1-phosphate transferase [Thermoleophilaceae bacterium]
MLDEIRLLGAFATGLFAVYALTPVAIRIARRTGFMDTPGGYKQHGGATPYLGGTAVLAGFALGALFFGGATGAFAVVLLLAVGLWVVGTVDDKVNLGPLLRIGLEILAASILWKSGHGWEVFSSDGLNLLFTNLWVLALVNAFNLMDNMDGAASSVTSVSAFGIGMLALYRGDPVLAGLCLALSGACVGFLPYNLDSPARIFLGDGGSMPLGFLVAAATIALPFGGGESLSVLLTVMLVGLPVFDTALVIVSRRRRGIPLLTGGRDHTTHRLAGHLPSPKAVAGTLAVVQAALCGLAVLLSDLGPLTILAAVVAAFVVALVAVVVLETARFAPHHVPRED